MQFIPEVSTGRTRFISDSGKLFLQQLAGLPAGDGGANGMNISQGLLSLTTNLGKARGCEYEPVEHVIAPDRVSVIARHTPTNLRVESVWTHDELSGVWSRKDTIRNDGSETITIFRCLSSLDFPASRYEVYSQASCWCRENQGNWQEFTHGTLTLAGEYGRTTQGSTPYACLRDLDTQRGVAIHVIPCGNWMIRFRRKANMNSLTLSLDAGLADGNLQRKLAPGETLELPEILMQPIYEGPVEQAAAPLHSYLLRHHLQPGDKDIPFVYNTWYDAFDRLDVERLRGQLAAAKDVGCEVFVIDAGWYGAGDKDWFNTAGDWREANTRSFYGKMKEFAEEVRAAGLGFGVWMEPERLAAGVPVLMEHPEWFLKSASGQFYPDLENPAAYEYMRNEISRLVDTYKLVWMKIDFNHPVGPDLSGAESSGYYAAWYRLLDELHAKHPQMIFEGCASGGMRTDINTVSHFPLHFQSDSIEPIDMIRITEGAMLRLTPGRLGKWIGFRNIGKTVPEYGQKADEITPSVVAPGGAMWIGSRVWDPAFVAATNLCGVPGLTGDAASLEPPTRDVLRKVTAFYKTHRRRIARSVGYMLTPPKPIEDRTGWSAVQLQSPGEETSLVMAYRLQDLRGQMRFPLHNLSPDRTYRVTSWMPSKEPPREITGAELMDLGLSVSLPQVFRADIFVLEPK